MWALLWLIAVYPFHTVLHEGMHYLAARLMGRQAEIHPWPARIPPDNRLVFGYSIYFGETFKGRQQAIFTLAPLALELVWWTACGVPLLIWGRTLPLWAFLLITIESFAAIVDSFVFLFGFWTKTPKTDARHLVEAGIPEEVGRIGIFLVIAMAFLTLIPMAWRWT